MTIPHSPVGQRRIKMVMVEVLLHTATIPSVSAFCQDGLRLWRVCVPFPAILVNERRLCYVLRYISNKASTI